jgi:hypothetical protein
MMIHWVSTWNAHMKNKRAHILLPQDLIKEIDSIVGPRRRSAFLVETARDAVRRTKLLRFLENDAPSDRDADLVEPADSAARWVRQLRRESDGRLSPRKPRAKK